MAIARQRRGPPDNADLERIPGLSNVDPRQNSGLLPVVLAPFGCIAREDCWHEALQHHYSREGTRVLVTFTSIGYRAAENRVIAYKEVSQEFFAKDLEHDINWLVLWLLVQDVDAGNHPGASWGIACSSEATFL